MAFNLYITEMHLYICIYYSNCFNIGYLVHVLGSNFGRKIEIIGFVFKDSMLENLQVIVWMIDNRYRDN